MVFEVSLVMKTGMLIILMVTVYFTITSQVDLAQKTKHYNYMKEIAEYTESKILHGMNSLNSYNSNNSQLLLLPYTKKDYKVELSCTDYLYINVSSSGTGRYYQINERMNCSKIQASGTVYAGEKCLKVNKLSEELIELKLEDSCGTI